MSALAPLLIANVFFFVEFARKNHKNFPSQKAFQKSKGCLNTGIVSIPKRGASGWWLLPYWYAANCKAGPGILCFCSEKEVEKKKSPLKFLIF